ncbi:uncharacterized protein BDV17DRAFT_293213 [Aspergillus undulatus]|uniref:uncharacterized protein n=1 Tax=Aspergillus undulatus TaxID=1810928 RepID=UPI003CCC9831
MRPLLLTFDAFNSLFLPRRPIPWQYANVAASFNISVSPDALQPAFRASYKALSASHPNFGRELALRGEYAGPQQWWEDVIRGTFARALDESGSATKEVPDALVQDLLTRFSSDRGYRLFKDVKPFFHKLRDRHRLHAPRKVIVGVVSNSDDRISSVLEALRISVGDPRAGEEKTRQGNDLPGFEEDREKRPRPHRKMTRAQRLQKRKEKKDIDFILTSYQAGVEKPDPLIWDIALRTARELHGDTGAGTGDWECIHVGDDYDKDYSGALNAGWKAYHLLRDPEAAAQPLEGTRTITSLSDLLPEIGLKK